MAQYSSVLARRTGTAHLKSSSGMAHGNNFFESVKNIPDRLLGKTAREPVMFGSLEPFSRPRWHPLQVMSKSVLLLTLSSLRKIEHRVLREW